MLAAHGGFYCTLVDIVGSMALIAKGATFPSVSTDISVSFMSSAKEGDIITILGKCEKMGRVLGFTSVLIKKDGESLAKGSHTKYILQKTKI
jgi:acyl-coenzyme A thioesterase 13